MFTVDSGDSAKSPFLFVYTVKLNKILTFFICDPWGVQKNNLSVPDDSDDFLRVFYTLLYIKL